MMGVDAEKRREQRRRAARDRVELRQREGGDAAVAARAEEQRRRQGPPPAETARSGGGTGGTRTRRPASRTARTANPAPGVRGYTLDPEALRILNEERDATLAGPARQKAAIRGLVPFDHERFVERLRGDELDRAERCSFATCAKSPKWMAPERAAGEDHYLWVVCNEHVAPRA